MSANLAGVDDVFAISAGGMYQSTLADALRFAFDRAGELAARHNLVGPLAVRLIDADMRCLAAMTLIQGKTRWSGEVEPGEVDAREGISFPWFLTLQDASGMSVKIRLDLDFSPLLM